ncbi:MAG TPA: integrin alpha [Planctomycetota bacterium]
MTPSFSTRLAAAVLLLLGPSSWSQTLTRSIVSRELWPDMQAYEAQLVRIADQTSDGVSEILVGDHSFRFLDMNLPRGKVSVLDGATGEELWGLLGETRVPPPDMTEGLGFSLTEVGDRDGDGLPDILTGSLFGRALILSARDGEEIHRSSQVVEIVASLGDIDGDGVLDLAFRSAAPPWGKIDVRSGRTLDVLYSVQPPFLCYLYGHAILSIGDVDGDLVPDYAVSAPDNAWNPVRDFCNEAYVFVYSGRTGTLLYFIPRPGAGECEVFGYSLAAPGDLNGDEIPDLVIGQPNVGYIWGGVPRLYFHDGKSGARINEIEPPVGLQLNFARVLLSVGDANGNGHPDLLVSNTHLVRRSFEINDRGEALLIDTGTREILYRITSEHTADVNFAGSFAMAMAHLGDRDGDEFPDFLIGTTGLGSSPGRLDWYEGAPQGIRVLGQSCTGNARVAPRIGASGAPRIGRDYAVHLSRVEPDQKALLAVGFPGSAGRFGWLGAMGRGGMACAPAFLPTKVHLAVARSTVGKEAAATVKIPIANDPALVGRVLVAQWHLIGGRGPASTRVLEITIQEPEPARED